MARKLRSEPAGPEAATLKSVGVPLHHHKVLIALVSASLLVLGMVVGGLIWYYQDRALPNTMLGNISVGGKTKDEVRAIAESEAKQIELTFQNGEEKVQASLADVGVTVDIDGSVNEAINARRNWLDIVLAWQPKAVPLMYASDLGVAKVFAKEHFPALVSDAQDAQLVFNTASNQFDIKPGAPGKGFDVVGFVTLLEQLAVDPKPVTLPIATSPVQPVIQDEKLQPIKEQADKVATLAIKFSHDGKVMYNADPADIAGWTHFTPDPSNNTVNIEYDQGAILQFLNQKVGPSIAAPAVDRKIVRDSNTGKEITIQTGREGRQLADVETLASEVLKALQNNMAYEKTVTITTAPFKTVTLAGTDRWVEVDLSEQRTSLYLGAERVASFTISSGVAKWPTVTGEFAIRHKNAVQVMSGGSRATGDYYYLPGVTWVSYFYRDYGFHTAYWHNNFGHPMSHGCINMKHDDAKALYDFAPIGTRVIVHS